ncbi:MAG: hypothetical protein LAT84_02255 [Balneolia bacterium]|nr:hypothetical protein [Balneolia bacterium]
MSKKSIDRKKAGEFIERRLEEGVSRQEILSVLKEQYYDEKSLANMIAFTPDPQKRADSITLIYMLVATTALIGIFQFVYAFGLYNHSPEDSVWIVVRVMLGLGVVAWSRYLSGANGALLQVHSLLAFLTVLLYFLRLTTFEVIFLLLSAVMALVLRQRLFSHAGFTGARKDKKGNWILG